MRPIIVPDGSLILDTDQKLTIAQIKAIAKTTYQGRKPFGIFRYLSLYQINTKADLDPEEASAITGEGLALGAVQHALDPGWTASAQLGQTLGTVALRHAQLVGLPETMHISQDDEGAGNSGTPVRDCYIAWNAVLAGGIFAPLQYVGYKPGLTPEELYDIPNVHGYWGAPGAVVATRGFFLRQGLTITLPGLGQFDPNDAHADALGGRLIMAAA